AVARIDRAAPGRELDTEQGNHHVLSLAVHACFVGRERALDHQHVCAQPFLFLETALQREPFLRDTAEPGLQSLELLRQTRDLLLLIAQLLTQPTQLLLLLSNALGEFLHCRLHAFVEAHGEIHARSHPRERFFPRQNECLETCFLAALLERVRDQLCQVQGVPRFVSSLRSEILRQDQIVSIALNFLLGLCKVPLRGLQRARRIPFDACLLRLRDERSCFCEHTSLDRRELRLAQQHLRFRRAALSHWNVAGLV